MRARLLACLLVLLAGPLPAQEPPPAPAPALAEDGSRLTDPGWGFELTRPDAGWRLLEEPEARRTRFGAVAGLAHEASGATLLVLVRPAGDRDAAAVAAARRARLELHDVHAEPAGKRPLAGLEALAWEASGEPRGRRASPAAGAALVERGRQLELLWLAPAGCEVAPPWEALRLAGGPGPLAGRPPAGRGTPDLEGLGWRVRDGVAESATLGVRVDPRGTGLRLLVGSAARQQLADAELALGDDDRSVWVGLVPLRAGEADAAAVWTGSRWGWGPPPAPPPKPLPPVPVVEGRLALALGGGAPCPLRWDRHEEQERPWEAGEGVACRGGAPLLLVRARARVRPDSQRREVLATALDCVTPLPEAERAALDTGLLLRPDPQGQVGKEWWYRGDALRHAGLDLTWTRPAGWRVVLDEEVLASSGPDTLLWAEAPRGGLVAWAQGWRGRGDTPEGAHAAALEALEAGPREAPWEAHATPAGLRFRCSWREIALLPGLPRPRALVATCVQGDRALRVVVTGPAEALEVARPAALALLDGFELEAFDLVDEAENQDAWRSKRLGVVFRAPAPGWRLLASAPEGGRARQLEARDDDGRRLLLLISGTAGEAPDPARAEERLRQALLRELEQGDEESLDFAPERRQAATLGGAPAARFSAQLAGGPAELVVCHAPGRTLLLVALTPAEVAPVPLETLQRALQLLP